MDAAQKKEIFFLYQNLNPGSFSPQHRQYTDYAVLTPCVLDIAIYQDSPHLCSECNPSPQPVVSYFTEQTL